MTELPHHHHQLISLTNTFNNPRFNSSTKAFSHSNHGLFHLKLLLHLSFFQKSIFFITSSFRFEFKKSLGHDFAKHSLHSNYSTKIYMYHPPQSSTPPRYQSISTLFILILISLTFLNIFCWFSRYTYTSLEFA